MNESMWEEPQKGKANGCVYFPFHTGMVGGLYGCKHEMLIGTSILNDVSSTPLDNIILERDASWSCTATILKTPTVLWTGDNKRQDEQVITMQYPLNWSQDIKFIVFVCPRLYLFCSWSTGQECAGSIYSQRINCRYNNYPLNKDFP